MDQLLTTPQAAEYLKISKSTLERWRRDCKPNSPMYTYVGMQVRYRESDLEKWIENNVRSTPNG